MLLVRIKYSFVRYMYVDSAKYLIYLASLIQAVLGKVLRSRSSVAQTKQLQLF